MNEWWGPTRFFTVPQRHSYDAHERVSSQEPERRVQEEEERKRKSGVLQF
jgi:hypothetical protein